MREKNLPDEWIANSYLKGTEDFEERLRNGHHLHQHISSQSAIHALVTGKYKDTIFTQPFSIPRSEVKAWLDNVIRLLTYTNYELALLGEKQEEQLSSELEQLWWQVTGNHCVFLETWWRDKPGEESEIDYIIREPSLVKTFREHFQRLWRAADLVNKPDVTRFLQEEMKNL